MAILAIDIGGTNIKYALCDQDGGLSDQGSMATEAYKGASFMMDKVEKLINQYGFKNNIEGIAISSAGQIDAISGKIIFATETIPSYTGVEIKNKLEEKYNIVVTVENDVNCAALGEMWKGNVDTDSFVAITLGTGIGGAIVEKGRIYHGSGYSAGEFGHMTLIYDGLPCNCGYRGCYEQYASARALETQIKSQLGNIEPIEFFKECKRGNKAYLKIYSQWIEYLSEGLRTIVHLLNPNLILIGGGISKQGEFLEKSIKQSLDGKIMASFNQELSIRTMTLGNDANLWGAVYYHLNDKHRN